MKSKPLRRTPKNPEAYADEVLRYVAYQSKRTKDELFKNNYIALNLDDLDDWPM